MSKETDMDEITNLKGFKQHHVVFHKQTGNQVVGDCPFCGKENHFYVNVENRLWDCKVCSSTGNFEQFLQHVGEQNVKGFNVKAQRALAESRAMPIDAFQDCGIGFDGNLYTLPAYNAKGGMADLRLYRLGKSCQSSWTATTGLFNMPEYSPDDKRVYLCEGEWDTLVWRYVLAMKQMAGCVALGVPGAGTFKDGWIPLLEDKEVYILYDHDKAGREGELKVYKKLQGVAKSVKCLHWPDDRPEGFDLRDAWKEQKGAVERVYGAVTALLRASPRLPLEGAPPASAGGAPAGNGHAEPPAEESVEPITRDELLATYRKWLHFSSFDPLYILYGALLANKLPGEPIWLFLVAPPGGSKSELLMSLSGYKKIHALTSITPQTLVSGMAFKDMDPSLLPKLKDKVLVIKDFTTILTMHYSVRDEIFGVLRDIYDGSTEKVFGNGVRRKYEVKFGILAGVTPTIETFNVVHQSLGERFLKFRITGNWDRVSEEDKILRALNNLGRETTMKAEMRAAATRFLTHFDPDPSEAPELEQAFKIKLVHLAKFSARLRGVVERDKFSSHVLYKPSSEIGTRIAKQLAKLAQGIAMFLEKKQVDVEVYRLIRRVALDTVPDRVEDIVRSLWEINADGGGAAKTMEIVQKTRLPQPTVYRVLDDMVLLKMVEKRSAEKGASWMLSRELLGHIRDGEVYEDATSKDSAPTQQRRGFRVRAE